MPDLKAAAKMLNDAAAATAEEMKVFRSGEWHDQAKGERDAFLLAAQALEALAWAEEHGSFPHKIPPEFHLGKWRILGRDQYGHLKNYYADTPLGALLAAMEGERDGK